MKTATTGNNDAKKAKQKVMHDNWLIVWCQAPGQDKKAVIICQEGAADHVEASNSHKA